MVIDYFDYILGKLEESKTKRERFVTTDLNLVKAIRELEKKGLIQYRLKMQPAQPKGLICHDDDLNTLSDWAEKMICQLIGAKQTAWNCKGHDGVLSDGTKIEVKRPKITYHTRFKKNRFQAGNLKDVKANLLILAIPGIIEALSHFRFLVIPLTEAKNFINPSGQMYIFEESERMNILNQKFGTTLSELTNLKHGYDYFLKMKGKTPPVEMPKESIQFVVDAWESNKYGLMPFDWRYEDSSWYAEFMVAHFLNGKVTEQRCAGYDVVIPDGTKVSVKMSSATKESDGRKSRVRLTIRNGLYDVLICPFWFDKNQRNKFELEKATFLILPHIVAETMKDSHNMMIISSSKRAKTFKKFRPFMFTIDHLAELGQIGWEAFYNKYLKESCAETLQKYGKGDH